MTPLLGRFTNSEHIGVELMSEINPYKAPKSNLGTDASKPKLFLYSLLLPVLSLLLGFTMNQIYPGASFRLGIPGFTGVLAGATFGMSWLMARKHHRPFSSKECWILIGYCFVWSFLLEANALFYALSLREEAGITLSANVTKFSIYLQQS